MKMRVLAALALLLGFSQLVSSAASTPFIVVNGVQLKANGQIFNTQPPSGGVTVPGTAGVWYNVTPAVGQHGAAVIIDPFTVGRVWLGTREDNDQIWRTDDFGATWVQVNTGSGGVGGSGFGGVGDGAQWSMQLDPSGPGILYATSGYGAQNLWKTTDGGVTWADVLTGTTGWVVNADRWTNNVSLDPSNHLHLVVSSHGACTSPYAPSCFAETTDGGSTWTMKVAPAGWEEGGGVIIVSGSTWIYCGNSYMKITTNAGSSWSNVTGGATSCEAEYTIREFKPAANGKYYLGSRDGMLSSSDGTTWAKISGTSGLMVMVTYQAGGTKMFASDQWSKHLWKSTTAADGTWTEIAVPDAQIDAGGSGGLPFLAYDETHDVLFAGLFDGGAARIKSP